MFPVALVSEDVEVWRMLAMPRGAVEILAGLAGDWRGTLRLLKEAVTSR